MNRRTFLKQVGGALAGIAGLCLLPKKEELGWRLTGCKPIILDDNKTCSVTIDKAGGVQNWNLPCYSDFPEQIKSVDIINGKLFVLCENSIWKCEDNTFRKCKRI